MPRLTKIIVLEEGQRTSKLVELEGESHREESQLESDGDEEGDGEIVVV